MEFWYGTAIAKASFINQLKGGSTVEYQAEFLHEFWRSSHQRATHEQFAKINFRPNSDNRMMDFAYN